MHECSVPPVLALSNAEAFTFFSASAEVPHKGACHLERETYSRNKLATKLRTFSTSNNEMMSSQT